MQNIGVLIQGVVAVVVPFIVPILRRLIGKVPKPAVPLLAGFAGALTSALVGLTPQVDITGTPGMDAVAGMISGLAGTGLHQIFKLTTTKGE
jgi:hypothetical protein